MAGAATLDSGVITLTTSLMLQRNSAWPSATTATAGASAVT
jgi:hypothetical protein